MIVSQPPINRSTIDMNELCVNLDDKTPIINTFYEWNRYKHE